MNALNIVFFGNRVSTQARVNLLSTLEALSYPEVVVSVAFGGKQRDFVDDIIKVRFPNGQPSNLRILHEPDAQSRFRWSLMAMSEWILFVSDDDVFTNNYLTSYLEYLKENADHISQINVLPTNYFIRTHELLEHHECVGFKQDSPYDRVQSFICAKHRMVGFYSMHKKATFSDVYSEYVKVNFTPSYFDQVLLLYSAFRGQSIALTTGSALFYDLENWKNASTSTLADLRNYKNQISLFFHEVYWVRDYIRILGLDPPPIDFQKFFIDFIKMKLATSQQLIGLRFEILGTVPNSTRDYIIKVLSSLHHDVESTPRWDELREVFDFNAQGELDIDVYVPY